MHMYASIVRATLIDPTINQQTKRIRGVVAVTEVISVVTVVVVVAVVISLCCDLHARRPQQTAAQFLKPCGVSVVH